MMETYRGYGKVQWARRPKLPKGGGKAGAPKDSFEGRTAVKLKFQLIRGQS